MARDWSRDEVTATVQDYLDMLVAELRGQPYSKADRRRNLLRQLDDRSKGAVEFKHANISAWMVENGLPYVEGYRPRFNYQNLIGEIARSLLAERPQIADLMASSALSVPTVRSDLLTEVGTPTPFPDDKITARGTARSGLPDYVALQEANTELGNRGEETVLEYEIRRLTDAGRGDLARKVTWVARTEGPSAGYDILSFDFVGVPRHLEVKTTNFGMYTPFYLSSSELEHSRNYRENYELRRVFDFSKEPRMFKLVPPLESYCRLQAVQYRASWGT